MSKFITKVEHLPTITEIEMSSSHLKSLLQPLDLRELHLWDSRYFYCSHEDWGKVLAKVLLGMPKYVAEKWDCEQYAMRATVRAGELFQLNTLGLCIGQSPFGYHGFNIFVSDAGLYYLEPQSADIYNVAENPGYKAELVIFG